MDQYRCKFWRESNGGGAMESYLIQLNLKVSRRADGSYIATCDQLPILITARDLPSFRRKLGEIEASVDRFLLTMPEAEQKAYLKERGVNVERMGTEAEEITLPVLVGA